MSARSAQNLIEALAAAIALASLIYVARQSRIQASAQRLSSISETDRRWDKLTKIASKEASLSVPTLRTIRSIYSNARLNVSSCLPPVGQDLIVVTAHAPFLLQFLLPSLARENLDCPDNERDYITRGMAPRVSSCLIVLELLRLVAEGDETTLTVLDVSTDAAEAVRADFSELCITMDRYIKKLNDIIELYDIGILERYSFLAKRYAALVRIAAVCEPYVLWKSIREHNRWGMRILSIGSAARDYHKYGSLQVGTISLKYEPVGYHARDGYLGLGASVGSLFVSTISQKYRRGPAQVLAQLRLNWRLHRGFRMREKVRFDDTRLALDELLYQNENSLVQRIIAGPSPDLRNTRQQIHDVIAVSWD